MLEIIPVITYAISGLAAIVVAVVLVRSNSAKEVNRINRDNITALQTQNELQAKEMKDIKSDNKDLKEQVTQLGSKVETLSSIPLGKIERHMAATNAVLEMIAPLLNTHIEATVKRIK